MTITESLILKLNCKHQHTKRYFKQHFPLSAEHA